MGLSVHPCKQAAQAALQAAVAAHANPQKHAHLEVRLFYHCTILCALICQAGCELRLAAIDVQTAECIWDASCKDCANGSLT